MLRKRAIDILLRIVRDGAYSNLEMIGSLGGLDAREKAFVTRLVYGTLTYRLQADYLLQKNISKPLEKLDKEVLLLLESAVYQKLYMDSVPDYAIINESVNLTRKFGKASASGFVNGVLRKTLKNGLDLSGISENTAYFYSIKYSLPKSFCSLMMKQYGNLAEKIFEGSRKNADFTARVNTLKIGKNELIKELHNKGIIAEGAEICPDCIKFNKGFGIKDEELFKKGFYYPQDEASAMAAYVLSPKPHETVIDLCAAPGGKTTYLAQLMGGKGKIIAFDIYEHKTKLISALAEKMGIDIIETRVGNSAEYRKELELSADKVLADCPCSGYGLLRKKPELEIKESTAELENLQLQILDNAAKYLKKGGELVYSTCTVNKNENIGNVTKFLDTHNEFELVDIEEYFRGKSFFDAGKGYVQVLPGEYGMDGFFIAKMKKSR